MSDKELKKLLEENEKLKKELLVAKAEAEKNKNDEKNKVKELKNEKKVKKLEYKKQKKSLKMERKKLKKELFETKGKKYSRRKKILSFIVAFFVLFVFVIAGVLIYLNSRFDVEKFKNNIVLILGYDSYGELISTGSGVYINSDTIYTNAHVIDGTEMIEVVLENNEKVELKGIQSINKKKDIAILVTKKVDTVKELKFKENVKVGTEVYAVGSPLGLKNTVSDGVISGTYKDKEINAKVYQHTAPISPGSSGGALVDKHGKLIGINYASYADGQNLNLAIKIKDFNKEYEKTKNDDLIKIETSDFFEIKELMNAAGKDILKSVCAINLECNAFYDKDSYFRDTEYYKQFKDDVTSVFRIESLRLYDSTYKGNDWVRIYIFELDDRSTDNDEAFKKLVEYKAIETRDSYYNLDFEYYWSINNNYYYYIEYSKKINIDDLVVSLVNFTGGDYE